MKTLLYDTTNWCTHREMRREVSAFTVGREVAVTWPLIGPPVVVNTGQRWSSETKEEAFARASGLTHMVLTWPLSGPGECGHGV